MQKSFLFLQYSSMPRRMLTTATCMFLLLVCTLTRAEIQNNNKPNKQKVLSLKESIERSLTPEAESVRREYWQQTFHDIRNLAAGVGTTTANNNNTTNMKASNKRQQRRRFEGFLNWDRLLQDWADDVQEYLDEVQAASSEYPMSTFGKSLANTTTSTSEPMFFLDDHDDTSSTTAVLIPTKKKETALQPLTPAPAKPGEAVLPHTNLSDKSKRIWIVTTASLPWMTGTAVNALLRAAYLTRDRKAAGGKVTILLPWLERAVDQTNVYGAYNSFETPEQQEAYVRGWLRNSAGLADASDELGIQWYTAWQNKVENSIYSMGDITALIPEEDVDICILEEPEHLNWYRAPGESWTTKFKHVIGIMHTNYFQYALDQPAAIIRAPAMRLLCSWMCRAHCHRVIKLSATLGVVAPEKELVENTHGVRKTFLDIGKAIPNTANDAIFGANAEPTVYFIGKLLWSKGLGSLMELLKYAEESADLKVKVDMYGGGPDKDAAESKARSIKLDMPFHGPLDHAEIGSTHKIFVNPSTSEVLCTTSAEALAMGKFVILPSHPSNDFFEQFPNCLSYATKEEFVANLYYAITHSPEPLSDEVAYTLSWEAATKRLEAAGCITKAEAERMEQAVDSEQAGIEITLPPLVEDVEGRALISNTVKKTRDRFRQFRTRLSNEIQHNKVLPNTVRERLLHDLNKRFDFDIDEMLESPKLKFKVSPAELDHALRELHDKISESPGGDVLRLIGGGGVIALQNLYLRRQEEKRRKKRNFFSEASLATADEDVEKGDNRTATQRIRWAMTNNIPKLKGNHGPPARPTISHSKNRDTLNKNRDTLNMCASLHHVRSISLPTHWSGLRAVTGSAFVRHPVRRSITMTPLI